MLAAYEDERHFDPDTPEAILRCAVAVACCDDVFAYDEEDRVRSVYDDICQEMTVTYSRPETSGDYREITEFTARLVLSLVDNEKRFEYIKSCGQLIIDKDLQELTLIMAMRVAGGDAELHGAEFKALTTLANLWQINLSDVLQPYLN